MNTTQTFIHRSRISSDICHSLIDLFNSSPNKYQSIVKAQEDSWNEIDYSPVDPVMSEYILALQTVVDQYISIFPYSNMYAPFTILEPIKIQYYKPGEGYNLWHTERGTNGLNRNRHLVFMTYLNTVTDQGGTEFMHQDFIADAEEGVTLIWPTDWTHTHRGIISPTQEKYIITGWFNFYEKNN
jgi:hypothetical protein